MGRQKVKGWKKEGSSGIKFLNMWIFPQDIQGILRSVVKEKVRGMGEQVRGNIQQLNGDVIQVKGSNKSGLGMWLLGKEVGAKVRVFYKGGSKEGGEPLKKGIKDYKQFKAWKKKDRFFPDYEFFGC